MEEAQDDLTGNLDERSDDNKGEEVCVDVDENIEEFNEQTTCNLCGRIFTSQYHLERHHGSNMCKNKRLNMTVEARAIRLLLHKLESNEIVVNQYHNDMSYLAQPISSY